LPGGTAGADLAENERFPDCTEQRLVELTRNADLGDVASTAIEVPTVFELFEGYWHPFTLRAGAAPGYCVSLQASARSRLKACLQDHLPRQNDASIALAARTWAIRARVS
jgi:hypothetical protein